MEEADAVEDFIVFLKTYEEAQCLATSCKFTWVKAALPAISSYSVDFDTTLNDYILTISGSNFGATTSNTQVLLDEFKQSIVGASDSELKVQIVNMINQVSLNVDIYLPIGTPAGTESLTLTDGVAISPKFLSIDINSGSPAGSIITASVRGVGTNNTGLTLASGTTDICERVTIPKYGVIKCKTKAMSISTSTSLKLMVDTTYYDCLGTNGECDYNTESTYPTITSVALIDSYNIGFEGTGLDALSSLTTMASFLGVDADLVTTHNSTHATALYSKGVPIGNNVIPRLYFIDVSTGLTHWAVTTVTLSNSLPASIAINALSCSYAGGCSLNIPVKGLVQNLKNDTTKNVVRVCSQVCALADADENSVNCQLPPLATTKSVTDLTIISESYLFGTAFSSNAALTNSVWDGSN
jgi:hypothetical protein